MLRAVTKEIIEERKKVANRKKGRIIKWAVFVYKMCGFGIEKKRIKCRMGVV